MLAFQTAIAKSSKSPGDTGLDPNEVVFHWFQRDEKTGATQVRSVTPDHAGRYGEFPIDFGATLFQEQKAFLAAAREADRRHAKAGEAAK
jgi:hypothetical protein